jgi:hypothetical protein
MIGTIARMIVSMKIKRSKRYASRRVGSALKSPVLRTVCGSPNISIMIKLKIRVMRK